MFADRIKNLRLNLNKKNIYPYLISDLKNIYYLTGFQGSYAYLLITKKKAYFISDTRYQEYAQSILPEATSFILQKNDIFQTINRLLIKLKLTSLYIENHNLTLNNYSLFRKKLKGTKINPIENKLTSLRLIKDKFELADIKKAAEITDKCLEHLITLIKPGIFEWDLAIEIDYFFRKHGCRKTAFEPIVASGYNSSKPHHKTSSIKKIKSGEILLIDLGGEYNGYNSDLTRTFFVNKIKPEFKKLYKILRKAQQEAIDLAKPGLKAKDLDLKARDYITKNGYGDYFTHSLGHGVGLEVHENPIISHKSEATLKPNMVFTIEPGIYLPYKGGFRIEDLVLLTETEVKILSKFSKEIIII